MISVEEALGKVLSFVAQLNAEERPLLDCLGQVLVDDISASFDVPLNDNSAMDGYAVQYADITGASNKSPKLLKVIGEIPAGIAPDLKVDPGTVMRIMTGAVMPQGADTVVPFEDTDEEKRKDSKDGKAEIGIYSPVKEGSNVRRHGEDITSGELVFRSGRLLSPADIGVLASLGKSKVAVIRRPIIGILATGNELVDADQPLTPGKIYNSNSYSLAAQVLSCGGIPKRLGIARDTMEQLTSALHRGFDCDMLITSGGVSMGDYDFVKEVLAAEGSISFWTVRMKPGKPLAFGTFMRKNNTRIPHLGLPGNPVSSMISFEVFARPAIYKMMGRNDWARPVIKARMEQSFKNNDGRRIFARVVVAKQGTDYVARLTGEQGSGVLTSMTRANGIAVIPETASDVKAGDMLPVMILDWSDLRST